MTDIRFSIFAVLAGTSLLAGAAPQPQTSLNKTMPYPAPLKSETQALQLANRLTGLKAMSGSASATETNSNTCAIPFLGKELVGKSVWRVEFDDCFLALPSMPHGQRDHYKRKFILRLDAETGQLIDIKSVVQGSDKGPQPWNHVQTEQDLRRSGARRYVALPDSEPAVNFAKTLDCVLSNGAGAPYMAKEIYGLYIQYSEMGSHPRPVWIITLRGLPPMFDGTVPGSPPGYQSAKPETTQEQIIVDASTGRFLSATTGDYL